MRKALKYYDPKKTAMSAVEAAKMEAKAIERSQKSELEIWLEDNERYCNIWGNCMHLTIELFYDINPYRLGKRLMSGNSISIGEAIECAFKMIEEKIGSLEKGHPDVKYYRMIESALNVIKGNFGDERIIDDNAAIMLEIFDRIVIDIWGDFDRISEIKRFNAGDEMTKEDLYAAMDKLHDMVKESS